MNRMILLIMIMMLCFTGCGDADSNIKNTEYEENRNKAETAISENEKLDSEKNEEEIWGVMDSFSAVKGGDAVAFYINFPSLVGIPEATGLVAYQKDETRVIVDVYKEGKSPEITGITEVLPAYFEQTIKIFKVNYGSRYSNGNLTIESQEPVTINDYEMCKYIGKHTFKYEGKDFSYQFVAYSTQLKTNGAYIYWLVQDESEDQSLYETIEDYAYKMGTTLWEE